MRVKKYIRFISDAIFGLHKTLYFNLYYFGFKGVKLPVLISKNVRFHNISGKITLDKHTFATVRIGFGDIAIFDRKKQKSIFENTGEINLGHNCRFGPGFRISNHGKLTFANNIVSTGPLTLICHNNVCIGDNCLLSWNVQIMDTDLHQIVLPNNEIKSTSNTVDIRNRVWLCNDVHIYKGAKIGNDIIVGARSTVFDMTLEDNFIYAGTPVKAIKKIIKWEY